MRKTLVIAALALAGCAQAPVKPRPQFDVVVTQARLEPQPVKSPSLQQVRRLVVADLSPRIENPQPGARRLYQSLIRETAALVAKDKHYQWVTPERFAYQFDLLAPAKLPQGQALDQLLADTAHRLGADGVLVVELHDRRGGGGYLPPQGAEVTASLRLMHQGRDLWQQKEALAWVDADLGLALVDQASLDSEVRGFMAPLVQALKEDYRPASRL
ncbi:hypothetical protein PVT67_17965 [Gallaecimonas kandeliae]|uniref:hypothetical protein n=1 Tax=Gallaecimonas kandeliae TaxID=3029055 RepID=UPI00264735EC|nr:hypothetical protein [Gallaecimonas kandeliae]WKE65528.1 hypothetical protein PVT67_17965 [Gallaecimonas kandeliae]